MTSNICNKKYEGKNDVKKKKYKKKKGGDES